MRSALFTVALICSIRSWSCGEERKAGPEKLPLAVSPFDAAQAKRHQEAWAKHLGVPGEVTNPVGMRLTLTPAGEFLMGSPTDEAIRLSVNIGIDCGSRSRSAWACMR